jgi:hypothetical protein
MFSIPKLFYAVLLSAIIAGCSKNEKAIEQSSYTSLTLKAMTVDPLMLSVQANEKVLTDSFYTPGNKAMYVQYFDPVQRFKITDLFSQTLLLDTIVTYKPGTYSITLFQAVSGGKLVRIGPPAYEPLPTGGKIKISVLYSLDLLPDVTRVVVEDSETGGSLYAATDSFMLKKGEFSPYFTGKLLGGKKPVLKFYTADASRKLVAKTESSTFHNTNSDFTIYTLTRDGASNGVISLGQEKLY